MDLTHSASFDLAVQFAGLLTPFILFLLGGLHMSNLRQFSELKSQLRHQDTCLDALRGELNTSSRSQMAESRNYVEHRVFTAETQRLRADVALELGALRVQQNRNIETIAEIKVVVAEIRALQRSNLRRISERSDEK